MQKHTPSWLILIPILCISAASDLSKAADVGDDAPLTFLTGPAHPRDKNKSHFTGSNEPAKLTVAQRRELATANSKEARDALMIKWGLQSLNDPNGSLTNTIDKYELASSDRERAALGSTIKTYYYVSDSAEEKQMIRQVFVDYPATKESSFAGGSLSSQAAGGSTSAGRSPASSSR